MRLCEAMFRKMQHRLFLWLYFSKFNLFNPSSTTYVKHFLVDTNSYSHDDASERAFVAGYANTTSAVNAIDFKFASGNIDDGIIKMYGVAKS